MSSLWDNAIAGFPMGVIESGCARARTLESREQATPAPFEHMERSYDRLGTRSALKWLSPIEFEVANKSKGHSSAA